MPVTTSAQRILHASQGDYAVDDLPVEFWELIERYRGELVNQGFAILGSLEDAEDVAQETFCEASRRPERLREVHSMGAWLRSINKANALNRLRDRQNTRKKESRREQELPRRLVTTGGVSKLELREAVAQAIEGLPADLRAVVVLHYWQHLPCDQISGMLELSPRTVWRRLHEADLILYETLGGFFDPSAPREE